MTNRKLLSIEMGRMSAAQYKDRPGSGIVVVLDNIRSAHNVGSAFRTADCLGIDKIWLCGICATPPSAEIHKSALGAEDSVEWEWRKDTLEVIQTLKNQGFTIISAEQTTDSVKLDTFSTEPSQKYAVIFGNEVDGVSQEAVDASDFSLEIPQYGTKHSFNVSVSIGIILWQLRCAEGSTFPSQNAGNQSPRSQQNRSYLPSAIPSPLTSASQACR